MQIYIQQRFEAHAGGGGVPSPNAVTPFSAAATATATAATTAAAATTTAAAAASSNPHLRSNSSSSSRRTTFFKPLGLICRRPAPCLGISWGPSKEGTQSVCAWKPGEDAIASGFVGPANGVAATSTAAAPTTSSYSTATSSAAAESARDVGNASRAEWRAWCRCCRRSRRRAHEHEWREQCAPACPPAA